MVTCIGQEQSDATKSKAQRAPMTTRPASLAEALVVPLLPGPLGLQDESPLAPTMKMLT